MVEKCTDTHRYRCRWDVCFRRKAKVTALEGFGYVCHNPARDQTGPDRAPDKVVNLLKLVGG